MRQIAMWMMAAALSCGVMACAKAPNAGDGASRGGAADAASSSAIARDKSAAAKDDTSSFAVKDFPKAPTVNAERAFGYVREIVGFGRRAVGSPGHKKTEDYIHSKLKGDAVEDDDFTVETPAGRFRLKNIIAKFPGSEDRVVVIGSHYDTIYPMKNFVGANDGGSSTGLLLEIANQLRGRKRQGPAVWLVFFDGEEAFKDWTDTDSIYGSRHLAEKWQQDGTAKKITAFLLLDMIGDKDLNIDRDENSSQQLEDLIGRAAQHLGLQSHFYARTLAVGDDHTPFAKVGIPTADLIDFDYGYANSFWHTPEDTMDKLSPQSLGIAGDVVLQTLAALGVR